MTLHPYEIYSKAEVCEFFDILPYTREEQAEEHVRRWVRLAEDGRQIRYAIALDGKVVGTCGLYSIYWHQHRACLGCDLHPDYWRQGIMTEALMEFLAQCYGAWGFTRIQGLVLPENRASVALRATSNNSSRVNLVPFFFGLRRPQAAVTATVSPRTATPPTTKHPSPPTPRIGVPDSSK